MFPHDTGPPMKQETAPVHKNITSLCTDILLMHLAPLLSLEATLSLAAGNKFLHSVLHDVALETHAIPARARILTAFSPSSLAVIKHIEVDVVSTAADMASVLQSQLLVSLTTLTITGPLLLSAEPCLSHLTVLNAPGSSLTTLLADNTSAGSLSSLRSLTIHHEFSKPFPQAADLLRALGRDSKLRVLTITSPSMTRDESYHSFALVLLRALWQSETVPRDLALVNLSFPAASGPASVVIGARVSALRHPVTCWRLGAVGVDTAGGNWRCGCSTAHFKISTLELAVLGNLGGHLGDFFAAPVHVVGHGLAGVETLGIGLGGLEITVPYATGFMYEKGHLYAGVGCVGVVIPGKDTTGVQDLLWTAAKAGVRVVRLGTTSESAMMPGYFPRLHEMFVFPLMRCLVNLRVDVRLLKTEEAEKGMCCGWSKVWHPAGMYQLKWIPRVKELVLDGWAGCSACWDDAGDGTVRGFVEDGAGGAGSVVVMGEFDLLSEWENFVVLNEVDEDEDEEWEEEEKQENEQEEKEKFAKEVTDEDVLGGKCGPAFNVVYYELRESWVSGWYSRR